MNNKALGKGLSALIPEKQIAEEEQRDITYVPAASVRGNPFQPRTNYNEAKLNELKASIQEKGVLQPILVRQRDGYYEVIAGERRLRAAQSLNFEQVPVMIKDVSDQEAIVLALIENIQREELNPIEEAEAYKKLIDEFQYSQETLARAVSKDRSTISNLLRLLNLPEGIKQGVYKGDLSVGHARALLGVETEEEQQTLYDMICEKGLSVREIENLIRFKIKSGPARKKKTKEKNYQLVILEEQLQKFLGTKVELVAQKKRGKIVIDYYSSEDLERIIKIMINKSK